MAWLLRAAIVAAGIAVASAMAMPVQADERAPSLQSFGAAKAMSAYELSATGVAGFPLQPSATQLMAGSYDAPLTLGNSPSAFSTALTSNFALDAGTQLDVATRFTDTGSAPSPFLSAVNAPFLDLANGGHYAGVTFLPASNLRVRLGTSLNNERLDQFAFDPISATPNFALVYDPSQTRSLLGGLSWDLSRDTGIDVSGIASDRNGVPLAYSGGPIAARSSTQALGVSAHLGLGAGWVTTASFSEGLSQLDMRDGGATNLQAQSYSIAVAKHGLFGDDTLGFSLSRPAPSLAGSFSSLIGSGGELPAMVIGRGAGLATRTPETDFQLGYITNFLDGAVALQANAAYQVNFQGQQGTNAVSLLSRAKIKF